ncbi:MAG: tRNA (adenosine(37)-N6)-dimethylallyltransferase MiaA [Paramuribaculum sp.]|nr:tRNA (adenosine(37)-N6)-dimethylallyltransferase MiaA [Paramuribaculum sp.]
MARPTLVVITGATASGKSSLAIELAQHLQCHIISADSRQIYRGIPIGTAAPTPEQLAAAPHHFVGMLSLEESYSAAKFESDVLTLLPDIWSKDGFAIMCGGSMMYIDAVVNGIDDLPDISTEIRQQACDIYIKGGLEAARAALSKLDPEYYDIVDKNNHKRIIHAIEITLQAGVPYSSLRTGTRRERPFNVIKLAIDFDRQTLFNRINLRVDSMIAAGLELEAAKVYHLRHLNSLNTVGYKELFAVIDGNMDRETAIARIAKNTRVYAKKQLTWLKRDDSVIWLNPEDSLQTSLNIIYDESRKTSSHT